MSACRFLDELIRIGEKQAESGSSPIHIVSRAWSQVHRDEGEGQTGERVLSAPVGRNELADSRLVQEWSGTPIRGATYYVKVINHSSLPVGYGLCDPYRRMSPLQEWE